MLISETFFFGKDQLTWENCGSNLVLMRNCGARFANSTDPNIVFKPVLRFTSYIVIFNPSNSRQQNKSC